MSLYDGPIEQYVPEEPSKEERGASDVCLSCESRGILIGSAPPYERARVCLPCDLTFGWAVKSELA